MVDAVLLDEARLAEASAVLARAFHDDPAWVFVFPDEERRQRHLPWIFRISLRRAIRSGRAYTTADVAGVVQWVPPGEHRQSLDLAIATVAFRLRGALPRLLAYGRSIQELKDRTPEPAYWYLGGIGVDPGRRRGGVGAALLRPGLDRADAAGLPCVLLTNNEANFSFYEAAGFAVTASEQPPRGVPRVWAMTRPPR